MKEVRIKEVSNGYIIEYWETQRQGFGWGFGLERTEVCRNTDDVIEALKKYYKDWEEWEKH